MSLEDPLTNVGGLWLLKLEPGLAGQGRLARHGAAAGHDLLRFGPWRNPGSTGRLVAVFGPHGASVMETHA